MRSVSLEDPLYEIPLRRDRRPLRLRSGKREW